MAYLITSSFDNIGLHLEYNTWPKVLYLNGIAYSPYIGKSGFKSPIPHYYNYQIICKKKKKQREILYNLLNNKLTPDKIQDSTLD